MKPLLEKTIGRLLYLLPPPIFWALVAILLLFGGVWVFTNRPELVPADVLLNLWFIVGTSIVVLFVAAYYVVRYVRARPKKTESGRIGIWLSQLEGDPRDGYLRNLKGQVEQELSPDLSLKDVEVSVYPGVLDEHDEARRIGGKLNAGAVVWGNLGRGLGPV